MYTQIEKVEEQITCNIKILSATQPIQIFSLFQLFMVKNKDKYIVIIKICKPRLVVSTLKL
jgi:hypothetical protein